MLIQNQNQAKTNLDNKPPQEQFSLLLPYYTSDKWTNKLRQKVKKIAEACDLIYERIENKNRLALLDEGLIPFHQPCPQPISSNQMFPNKTAQNFRKRCNYPNFFYDNKHSPQNYFNKTSSAFFKKNKRFFTPFNNYNNLDAFRINPLDSILPHVTNYNPSYDLTFSEGFGNMTMPYYLSTETKNIFCISDQHKNHKVNVNKFYNNNNKGKDIFYFGNRKPSHSTKNLFNSKANDNEINKFVSDVRPSNRIDFFKKNDYNVQNKGQFSQPKDRRQISAMKDIRKKQYLNYIKAKSEDNYMKFYYNQ